MHPDARQYVAEEAARVTPDERHLRVVEFGSFDVNGGVRDLFKPSDYHGIDTRPGPGVDETANAARWDGREAYDVVVCTETLEHAPQPRRLITAARRALSAGGVLIATMASPERAPHNVNGDPDVTGEHYRGIYPDELRAWLTGWELVRFEHHPDRGDLYVTARRAP